MQRARTLSGLFFQYLGQRWGSLGKRGRVLVVSLGVLLTAAAVHLATCAFGGCAAGPCQLAEPPCQRGAMQNEAMQSDEPCDLAPPSEAATEAAAASDERPCHRRR